MKEIIKIQGKWYNLIDMFGGRVFLCELLDINNDIIDMEDILWEMQPFTFEKDVWYGV